MVICAHCLRIIDSMAVHTCHPDLEALYNFGCKDKSFNAKRAFIRTLGVNWDLCTGCHIDLFNKRIYDNARVKLQIMKDLFYEKLLQVKEENKKYACYFCQQHCHGYGSEGLHHECDNPDKFKLNTYHLQDAFNQLYSCGDYQTRERLNALIREYIWWIDLSFTNYKYNEEAFHFFELDKSKKSNLDKFIQNSMTRNKWYKNS